jgi:hypothetical protein
MKNLFTLLIAMVLTSSIIAQAPQKMSYQCVVRNGSGNLLANQTVGLSISILQGSSSGTAVYQETYNPKPLTNANGLLNIEIGSGVASIGTFASIDWSTGLYYLKTETDPAGGTDYTINGVIQLLSVPYSIYSAKAGNGLNLATNPVSGDILFYNGTSWQLLSKGINGQTLRLDNGLPNWGEPGYALPLITTSQLSNIQPTSATSGGIVVSTGFSNITAKGVCWATTQNPTTDNSKTNEGPGIGTFTSTLTNLLPNTTYYMRAYAINSAGTAYGNQVVSSTAGNDPSLTTKAVTNILETTAIAGGTIISDGGAAITERGVVYGTALDPTVYDKKIASGSGLGTYSIPLTILVPNTLYYVRAYAINSRGTFYGNNETFTTADAYYAGFESGIPTGWTGMWSASADVPYEGFYCLKSVNPGDSIVFYRTIISPTGGQVSFVHRSDDGWPTQSMAMQFYIDNILQTNIGDEAWTVKTFTITSGTHKFKFRNNGGGYTNNVMYIDYFICPK